MAHFFAQKCWQSGLHLRRKRPSESSDSVASARAWPTPWPFPTPYDAVLFRQMYEKKHNYRATKRKRMLNGLPSSPVSGGGTPLRRNHRPTAVFPKPPDGREKGQRLPYKRATITLQKSSDHIAKGLQSRCQRAAVTLQKGSDYIAKGLQSHCQRAAVTLQKDCGCRAKSQQSHSQSV